MSTGVIYVAEGADYAALAEASAASLRAAMPDLPISIFTDVTGLTGFDEVLPIPFGCKRAKLAGMRATPYDRTLFLDCDTQVLAPFDDAFRLLDRFDLALAHDVRRSSALITAGWQADAPEVFCQHNSGVMFFRKSPAMEDFLADWARAYDAAQESRDQITLRDMLWDSDLRFWVLPPEWNLRRVTVLDAWEPLDAVPRILHSHQLLRHLRSDAPRVTDLKDVLALERAAHAREWADLDARAPGTNDPVGKFRRAKAARRE